MSGQLTEVAKQYPELQKSANAAKENLYIAEDTMHVDQRAWIAVRIQGARVVNQPYVIKAFFKNTGKTPAKHVEAYSFAEPVDNASHPNFNRKRPPVNFSVVMPGSETFIEMHPIKGDILNAATDKLFGLGERNLCMSADGWTTATSSAPLTG